MKHFSFGVRSKSKVYLLFSLLLGLLSVYFILTAHTNIILEKETSDLPNQKFLPEMVFVEAGSFMMGCTSEQEGFCYDDEFPIHKVNLSSFQISKTLITNAQFLVFLNDLKISPGGYYDEFMVLDISRPEFDLVYDSDQKLWQIDEELLNHPISFVTYHGAKLFCEWAGGRLPTEAEWEYAARGGQLSKGYRFAGSNNLDEVAWYTSNSGAYKREVALKEPNELGLFDMSGNVWEWCSDWLGYYNSEEQTNPTGPEKGEYRVCRGGGWNNFHRNCRITDRGYFTEHSALAVTGVRLVIPVKK